MLGQKETNAGAGGVGRRCIQGGKFCHVSERALSALNMAEFHAGEDAFDGGFCHVSERALSALNMTEFLDNSIPPKS